MLVFLKEAIDKKKEFIAALFFCGNPEIIVRICGLCRICEPEAGNYLQKR